MGQTGRVATIRHEILDGILPGYIVATILIGIATSIEPLIRFQMLWCVGNTIAYGILVAGIVLKGMHQTQVCCNVKK
jgi:hypothetical protein